MRRKSFLMLVSVLTAFFFVMTSCGGDDGSNDSGKPNNPDNPENPDSPVSPNNPGSVASSEVYEITIENSVVSGSHVEDDGTETMRFEFAKGNLMRAKVVSRDEVDSPVGSPADSYCDNITEAELTYTDIIKTTMTYREEYYPSGTSEVSTAEHKSYLENGRVTSGSIHKSWMNGDRPFELYYNTDGTLKEMRYNDIGDDGSDDWDNHYFDWQNGNLSQVKCPNMNITSSFTYDGSLRNPFATLDLNHLLITDEEFFDGTNGNVLKLLVIGGKLGKRTENLVKEYNSTEEHTPLTMKVTYEKLTETEVVAVVDTYESNQKTYSQKWTIKRTVNK